jgi:hypothetical protein
LVDVAVVIDADLGNDVARVAITDSVGPDPNRGHVLLLCFDLLRGFRENEATAARATRQFDEWSADSSVGR